VKRDALPAAERLPLGEELIAAGALTRQQLAASLKQQRLMRQDGHSVELGEILVSNQFVTRAELHAALTKMGRRINDLSLDKPLLAPSDCLRLGVSPVRIEDGALIVKSARSPGPAERAALLAAASEPCVTVRVELVDKPTLKRLLDAQMAHDSFEKLIERMRDGEPDPPKLRAALMALLHEAIDRRCSDIHLDNKPNPRAWVSMRIDSRLRQCYLLPGHLMAAVFARLKTISGMDGSNSRDPQDGRYEIEHRGRRVSFRLATQALVDGETMAIRVLDGATLPSIDSLFPNQPQMVQMLRRVARFEGKRGGLMLVTGATGQGKSTTLYAAASLIPRDTSNVLTVESPVEYILPYARQIQLSDLLKQRAIDIERSMLRQDPDTVIMGEVRDADTARACMKFGESGHLVMASLHGKSAAQSLERMLSMLPRDDRAEGGLAVAVTVLAVVHQVLVRKLCGCAVPLDRVQLERELSLPRHDGLVLRPGLRRAVGCAKCEHTGYLDRVALHETLIFDMNDEQRRTLAQHLVAHHGSLAGFGGPGLHHVTRESVASQLLHAGLIDLPTAEGALATALLDKPAGVEEVLPA
jgi:type II secretory ATPase GspE/PulE/Tfp pilus assembly ATPase PilB-like protein